MRTWISSPPADCWEWRRRRRGPRSGRAICGSSGATIPTSRPTSPTPGAARCRPRRSPRHSPWWSRPAANPSPNPRRRPPPSASRPDDVPGTYDRAGDPIGASLRHPAVALDDTRTLLLDANPMEAFLALHEVFSMLGVVSYIDRLSLRARDDRDPRAPARHVAAGVARSRDPTARPRRPWGWSRSVAIRPPISTSSWTAWRSCSHRRGHRSGRRNVHTAVAPDALRRSDAGPARRIPDPPVAALDRAHGHERSQRVRPLLPERARPHRRRLPRHRPRAVPEPRRDRRVRDRPQGRPAVRGPHVGRARRRPDAPRGRSRTASR